MDFETDIESNVDTDLSTPPRHQDQTSNGVKTLVLVIAPVVLFGAMVGRKSQNKLE